MTAGPIRWPDRYDPKDTPVHVRNEITIDAPCAAAWGWIIRAQDWPSWYSNSADVVFLSGQPPDLCLGTMFRWKTFGVRLVSTVKEFVPGERLAFDARGTGVDAYHAWLFQPTENGCHVVTEEVQWGWLARLQDAVVPRRMATQHQIWLDGLKDKATVKGKQS
jgi:hypothetical protein